MSENCLAEAAHAVLFFRPTKTFSPCKKKHIIISNFPIFAFVRFMHFALQVLLIFFLFSSFDGKIEFILVFSAQPLSQALPFASASSRLSFGRVCLSRKKNKSRVCCKPVLAFGIYTQKKSIQTRILFFFRFYAKVYPKAIIFKARES